MKNKVSAFIFFAVVLIGLGVFWKFNSGTIAQVTSPPAVAASGRAAAMTQAQDGMQKFIDTTAKGFSPDDAGYTELWTFFYLLTTGISDRHVFEYFRQTSSIFLAKGAQPPPLGSDLPLPQEVQSYMQQHQIPEGTPWHNLDSDIKVSGLDLKDKWNDNIRFSLRMNDSALSYLLTEKLFNADGLLAATSPISFPSDALELKTSWIWIDAAAEEKLAELEPYYFIAYAYYTDTHGQMQIGQAALTGFHMVLNSQPGWVWSTFENIHNAEFTQVDYELPIPDDLAAVNTVWQDLLTAENSIFANYRLNGAQVDFVVDSEPVLLANSQIESFFQSNSSCKTCHHIAAFKSSPRLDFFNIVDPEGQGTAYYVGDPPDLTGWTPMDYAWSLKRAQFVRP